MTTSTTTVELQFSMLGPLSVQRDGTVLSLGGPKQRAVLALLLVEPGAIVSIGRLLDGVWGEEATDASRASLHTYVSNLRALLGVSIERVGDGYRLEIDERQVDVMEFARTVEAARDVLSTDPVDAGDRLRQALELWKGFPFADLEDVPGLQTHIHRLEEQRLAAVELRIDADLAAARHERIVSEVGALADDYPLRERFRAQHMIALYRCGRQSEALRAFRRTEEHLAEELGIEPSQELRDLELAILQQDPELHHGSGRATTQRLAFLVTDIEDSTGAWDRHPQEMADALATHDRELGAAITEAGGALFKHTGDGVLAAFPDVISAMKAAESAQRRLAAADWGEVGELRVRMGIDIGDAEARGGDFFGPPLNRASRLTAAAHGGQVVVSTAAQTEIATAAPAGVQVRHLGEHVLRGFAAPERVGQLVFVGLPGDFPELRVGSEISGNDIAVSLPGYELREQIGEGAFGVIYRAYQPTVGREVAVKVIRPHLASHPSFIHRFEAEARTIARLAHPRIVPLIDFWRDTAGAYLVLQLLPAGSLRDAITSGAVDRQLARRVLHHIGEALDHAHAHGIVHGDLKPANILIDGAENAYLSDFAIEARLLEPQVVASMSAASDFQAPEEPLTGPSRAADLFALGAIARELIDEPDLEGVLARATAARPDDRYPDARSFLADLFDVLGEDTVMIERPAVSRNPYKGLRAFDESDAADFHGRDELVATLLAAVTDHRFVAVVGPSGSGKSSVVQAGLLPRLDAGRAPGSPLRRIVMTPGSDPFGALADRLTSVAAAPIDVGAVLEGPGIGDMAERLLPDEGELLVVVDQFEELYTLVDDEQSRGAFIRLIVDAVEAADSRVRVIVTLRADFYDRPLQEPRLGRLVRDGLVTVLRPDLDELIEMIATPAQAVGLRWEPGLPHRIARDVLDQPGGLPLLQYALTELVERRAGDLLTAQDYAEIGGAAGALARRADVVFDRLTPTQQTAARQVLLRLVQVDEESDDTRRRVRRKELESLGIDASDLDAILGSFVAERLLLADRDPVTRGPTVEVAHEALLRQWPRLTAWVEDQREALILGRRFRSAISEWETAGQDEGYLVTGPRLAPFLEWAESTPLSGDERRFFEASLRRDAEERAARERRRRTQLFVLAGAAVVAVFLAGWAFVERGRAADEAERTAIESEGRLAAQQEAERHQAEAETQAALALAQTELAEHNAEIARSRELAASAISVLDADPSLSKLLALAAADIADPPLESISALHRALAADRVVGRYEWPEDVPAPWEMWVHIDPAGERLVAAGVDGIPSSHLEVVDIATGEVLWTWGVDHPEVSIDRPRFIDGGRLVVAGALWETRSREGTPPDSSELGVFVFDAESGEVVDHFETGVCGATVRAASDTHVAAASIQEDGSVCFFVAQDVVSHPLELIDLQSGERVVMTEWSRRGSGQATLDGGADFSGDGRVLVFDDVEQALVVVVDVATGERVAELDLAEPSQRDSYVRRLDGDGSRLVYGTDPIRVVDLDTGGTLTEIDPPTIDSYVEVVGDTVFVNTIDGALRVYALDSGRESLVVSGAGSGVISSTSDGRLVLVSDEVRAASLVDVSTRGEILAVETCPGFMLAQSLMVSGSLASYMTWCASEPDNTQTSYLVDLDSGEVLMSLWGGFGQEQPTSPDGTRFVRQQSEGGIFSPARVWAVDSGEVLFELEGVCAWDGDTQAQLQAESDPDSCFQRDEPPFASVLRWFEWSPDGSMIAAVDGRTSGTGAVLGVWDGHTGEMLFHELGNTELSHHNDVTFTPDGSAIVASYWGAALRRFSSETWELELEAPLPQELTGSHRPFFVGYDEDGSHLIIALGIRAGSDASLHWLDAETLELDFSLTGVHDAGLRATALNADRSRLATASSAGVVRIWSTEDGRLLHEAPVGNEVLQGVAFVDDHHVAVTPQGGGLQVITTDTDELLDLVRRSLTRGFTPIECDKFNFEGACPTLEEMRGG